MKKNPVFLFFALISLIFLIALTGCCLYPSEPDVTVTPKPREQPRPGRTYEEIKNDVIERLEKEEAFAYPPESCSGFHGIPWGSSREYILDFIGDECFLNEDGSLSYVGGNTWCSCLYLSKFIFDEDGLLAIGVDWFYDLDSKAETIIADLTTAAIDAYGHPDEIDEDGAFWGDTPNGVIAFVYNIEPTYLDEQEDVCIFAGFGYFAPGIGDPFQLLQNPSPSPAPTPRPVTYILNTSTKKFHYPSCSSVDQMKESNKREFTGDREEVIARGYEPCGRCNP